MLLMANLIHFKPNIKDAYLVGKNALGGYLCSSKKRE